MQKYSSKYNHPYKNKRRRPGKFPKNSQSRHRGNRPQNRDYEDFEHAAGHHYRRNHQKWHREQSYHNSTSNYQKPRYSKRRHHYSSQAEQNSRSKLFVAGYDSLLDKSHIRAYFSRFGQVRSVSTKFDSNGRSKGYCFVLFKHWSSVDRVLEAGELSINGRVLKCDRVLTGNELKEKVKEFDERRLFIPNLDGRVVVQDIEDELSRFVEIENCYLINKNSSNTQFGYVTVTRRHDRDALVGLELDFYGRISIIQPYFRKKDLQNKRFSAAENEEYRPSDGFEQLPEYERYDGYHQQGSDYQSYNESSLKADSGEGGLSRTRCSPKHLNEDDPDSFGEFQSSDPEGSGFGVFSGDSDGDEGYEAFDYYDGFDAYFDALEDLKDHQGLPEEPSGRVIESVTPFKQIFEDLKGSSSGYGAERSLKSPEGGITSAENNQNALYQYPQKNPIYHQKRSSLRSHHRVIEIGEFENKKQANLQQKSGWSQRNEFQAIEKGQNGARGIRQHENLRIQAGDGLDLLKDLELSSSANPAAEMRAESKNPLKNEFRTQTTYTTNNEIYSHQRTEEELLHQELSPLASPWTPPYRQEHNHCLRPTTTQYYSSGRKQEIDSYRKWASEVGCLRLNPATTN